MKRLIIKKNGKEYAIDVYDIRHKQDYLVISGYDINGMYFQMKHEGKYETLEAETTIFMDLK